MHGLREVIAVNAGKQTGIPLPLQQLAALLALLVLGAPLALLALAIRLDSRGPALFWQTRVGLNGRYFSLAKFRSMYQADDPRFVAPDPAASDREGVCQKHRRDPRVTRLGRWLRTLSLDELPQLWNVLIGDMALIGPRPALPEEVDAYPHEALRRLDVMPGITGLWQISGRADTTFAEQVVLDVRYVQHQSWLGDLKILLRTLPAVVSARGAY